MNPLLDIASKHSSTKDLVVSILSEEWPLSAKELFSRVLKQSEHGVSYQAVHKVLLELCGQGVVCRAGHSFELDKNWLEAQKSFFERVNSNYLGSKDRYDLSPDFKGTVKMHFDDYTKFVVTLANILKNRSVVGAGSETGIGILTHAYWPLRFSFDDIYLLKAMVASNEAGYAVIKKDSPLDRWVVKEYLKAGFKKAKIVSTLAYLTEDLFIHGDGIITIHFSDETMEMLDEVYSRVDNISDMFKEFVKNTFSKKPVSIDISISKNPVLAKTLQAHFMSFLG